MKIPYPGLVDVPNEHGLAVTTEVSQYAVIVVPEEYPGAHHWNITVDRRGPNSWAVRRGVMELNRDGEWDFPPRNSDLTDDYLSGHRFPAEEALERAESAIPTLEVNGRTVFELLRMIGRY